ncbi:MAG: hypothetical protein J6336_08150 [Kiritimatiellae bacterium]|nr:hypothetical protein [Kiritimatiellia bacterium]
MNTWMMITRAVAGATMLCLVGCTSTDAVMGSNHASRRVKYVMQAVNTTDSRTSPGTVGQDGITPWTFTLEADTNLADMRAVPQETKCGIKLEHAKLAAPLAVDFTLRKKPPETMIYESMDIGITKFQWETVNVTLDDGWKLTFMLSGMDYPMPDPIAVMFSFGAYMRENYGASAFSEDGVMLVVKRFEENKTILIDLTRYTVKNKSLASHRQMFKGFVHGKLAEHVTPVSEKRTPAK